MKWDGRRQLGQFKWLVYPVMVGVAAVAMALRVFAADGVISKLREGWAGIEERRANVERLKARVEVLGSVSEGEADEDLKKLLLIVPATKQVWPIVAGLRVGAERSGVMLEGYSAGGQSLRVDVSVAGSWPAVIQFVEETEKQLPMRRVTEATFTAGKARVVVEGRWAPLAKASDVGGKEVGDYRESLSRAMAAVGGYQTEEAASESGEGEEAAVNDLF